MLGFWGSESDNGGHLRGLERFERDFILVVEVLVLATPAQPERVRIEVGNCQIVRVRVLQQHQLRTCNASDSGTRPINRLRARFS